MELIIREMIIDDWDDVSRIFQQGIDTNIATFRQIVPSREEFIADHVEGLIFVCELDGKICGWVALSPTSKREVYAGVGEISIYVDSGYKGKGVATKLINHLMEKAEQKGFWVVESIIIAENAASIQLHKKCGFRTIGIKEKRGKDRLGIWRDTILMERRNNLFP